MATTLVATGIQFPDSTIQTTSAGAVTSVATSGGLTGGTITTTGTLSINTNNGGGVGSYRLAMASGSSVSDNDTIAGSNLKVAYGNNVTGGNVWISSSTTLSGTWRNISGISLTWSSGDGGQMGIFIRTA
jgi:hypothetical protein